MIIEDFVSVMVYRDLVCVNKAKVQDVSSKVYHTHDHDYHHHGGHQARTALHKLDEKLVSMSHKK